MQGRPKGGTNKYWTKEEKLTIVLDMINNEISIKAKARELKIHPSLTGRWMKEYLEKGEQTLEPKRKPGNPLCKYTNRKNLTEKEQMEYEIMKLRIENERLKKGYIVKGDGQKKQFIILKDKNSK